ncbi:hypothetical protein BFP70_01795 [Thioclava sp. SK-1]|uniref:tannase/feruloyl esterase family alpha/beta hydrolase n=1 Tax=Thioclava sp. SK-1 TaxID=1889770 RepID=UPI00082449B8|nr:tannase/feruloyl esterase family alpha/beta hydrolase [Thioclava sp. SK-1]OCX67348.1 hypothetical protein BFP70_01795 [Thioclava sp. SK-1]
MRRMLMTSAVMAICGAGVGWAAGCQDMAAQAPAGVLLTAQDTQVDGVDVCQLHGTMAQRTGQDGRAYALRFELNLPRDWNGNYVHQFNGGNDGEVKPATGALKAGTGGQSPLARGYAVVSSDAGHAGDMAPDMGLAGGAVFGFDFEARQMYGYKAVAVLDPVARDLVQGYYGADIARSYGIGCSNGGRHAMVAASRMPAAFDGLLAGAPGYRLPKAALQHALDVQQFHAITGDLATAYTPQDLTAVGDAILAACDGLDGLEDGLIQDSAACQAQFDPATLADVLQPHQAQALRNVMRGTQSDGAPYYSDWAWDNGIAGSNWRMWKLQSPIPPWDHKPIIAVMGAASLAQVFTVPPTKVVGEPAALEDYLLRFDLATQAGQVEASSDIYPESPMQVMSPPGSEDPHLQAFRDAGGKMILFHGVADPVFSALDTQAYAQKLLANTDGDSAQMLRYYPVPGMTHCSGGPGLDKFDLFTALEHWVEDGTAPQAVIATARPDNDETPASLANAARPLCPQPLVARYIGGNPDDGASFSCVE